MPSMADLRRRLGNRLPLVRDVYRWGLLRGGSALRLLEYSLRGPESAFRKIYLKNQWGDPESRSGPGSNAAATAVLRARLPDILKWLDVKVLVDAPCGDLRWMSGVDASLERYIGVDIVPELIADLQATFRNTNREFMVGDLRRDSLPRADMVFCRDCLVHLSERDVRAALSNIRLSGATYLMTTTFPDVQANKDIVTGWFRPINLQRAPFHFPSPIHLVVEAEGGSSAGRKAMGVWRVDSLLA